MILGLIPNRNLLLTTKTKTARVALNFNRHVLILSYSIVYRIGQNEIMGCFTIGPSDPGKGRDHWLEMLENPRKPIAQWYPLLETVPIDLHGQKEAPMLLKCLKSR